MNLDFVVCAIGWIIIACHTWSLRYHFDMPVTPPGVRLISTLVILSAALLTYLVFKHTQPILPQLIGLVMLVFSFIMFWITIRESRNARLLAAFDEKMPKGLLTSGPYAWVRHPFYTSYLIQWIGWAVACWNVWGLVPVIGMTATYLAAANEEEQKFAKSEMAAEYSEYVKSTGRFFPKILK